MKTLRLSFLILLLITILFLFTSCDNNQNIKIPQELIGTWIGLGQHGLSSEYLDQKEVPFMLIISQKGILTGYVGDAAIMKANIEPSPFWLKMLGSEKFRAVLQLSGNIVNKESFKRDSGTISFKNISADELLCGFMTSGSKVDSKNMALPVNNIRLRHPD